MDLQDKRVLITGGTSGMGIATAQAMAEKGATVTLTGRDKTRGASAAEEIRTGGHDAQFIAADFSELSEVGRVAEAAGETDVLVNCAGVSAMATTAGTDEAAFDGLFHINVKAPFFLVAALAPKIAARGGGSIINVSTMVASYGQPGLAAYGATPPSRERASHPARPMVPAITNRTANHWLASVGVRRATISPASDPELSTTSAGAAAPNAKQNAPATHAPTRIAWEALGIP